jgi:hypothetical protein
VDPVDALVGPTTSMAVPGPRGRQDELHVAIADSPSEEPSATTVPTGLTIWTEIVPDPAFCADT